MTDQLNLLENSYKKQHNQIVLFYGNYKKRLAFYIKFKTDTYLSYHHGYWRLDSYYRQISEDDKMKNNKI